MVVFLAKITESVILEPHSPDNMSDPRDRMLELEAVMVRWYQYL